MKIKRIFVITAISLAMMTGSATLAQTSSAPGNINTDILGQSAGNNQNSDLEGQNNIIPRYGMMGRGSYNNGRLRMMNYKNPYANTFPGRSGYENVGLTAWHIFASIVTMLLFWTLLVLGILTLLQHLKTCRGRCRTENNEKKN